MYVISVVRYSALMKIQDQRIKQSMSTMAQCSWGALTSVCDVKVAFKAERLKLINCISQRCEVFCNKPDHFSTRCLHLFFCNIFLSLIFKIWMQADLYVFQKKKKDYMRPCQTMEILRMTYSYNQIKRVQNYETAAYCSNTRPHLKWL
jgi:hypothetical protein